MNQIIFSNVNKIRFEYLQLIDIKQSKLFENDLNKVKTKSIVIV